MVAGERNGMDGFQFSSVKAALVSAFGIAEGDRSRFFARLEHWRRVGLIAERPGKGTRATYSAAQIDKLAFIIQMSRFSIEPVITLELIKARWDPPSHLDPTEALQRGGASISELFAVARDENFAVAVARDENTKLLRQSSALKKHTVRRSHICVLIRIDDFVSKDRLPDVGFFTGHPRSLEAFYLWLGDGQNSATVFDLTARVRALDKALANPSVRPPDPPGQAGEIVRAGRRARGEP